MSIYLIVNTGSDSHKYAIYENNLEVFNLHLEKKLTPPADYANPIDFLFKSALAQKVIFGKSDIVAVSVRVVAPGEYFLSHRVINDDYLSKLRELQAEAPLHIGPALKEIEDIRKFLSGVKVVGISDSAFHKTLPEVASRYAIPEADVKLGVKKYGYHGISVASIVYKVEKWLGYIPEKVIVCHLGSGSSITALKNGQSVDTSMGLTPLDGPPMGSRVGAIDPGAVIALGQKKGLNYSELENYFNNECGLLGLSGKTKDVRDLLELERNGDLGAKLALESFVYSIKKYIGAYVAALGGLDLLVFTATIGERSFIIRERVCAGLQGLGFVLDAEKNNKTVSVDDFIHQDDKSIPIAVINTDEMGQMAREMVGTLL